MTNYTRLPDFAHHLLRARDWQERLEFHHLCEWWRKSRGGIYALVGIGGAGKTAIVDRFLQVLPEGYEPSVPALTTPAKRPDLPATVEPFIFSFYDDQNVDSFFVRLREWLADFATDCRPASIKSDATPSPSQLVDWLKCLASYRDGTLLVFDGLDKVQDDGQRTGCRGHIYDDRLRSMLCELGRASSTGRPSILITTRFELRDLVASVSYTLAPIEKLALDACVQLLRARGVVERDVGVLRRLAEEHGQHALTVDLLGGYVGNFCGGDVSRLQRLGTIGRLNHDAQPNPHANALIEQDRRFACVVQLYRDAFARRKRWRWFPTAQWNTAGEPATLALLERICLFCAGISADMLVKIFTGKSKTKQRISGSALASLSPDQLQDTLDRLVTMKLVLEFEISSGSRIFSIHPVVRDCILSGFFADSAQDSTVPANLTAALGSRLDLSPTNSAALDLLEGIVRHLLQLGLAPEAYEIHRIRIGGFQNLGHRLRMYERGERICCAFAGGESPKSLRTTCHHLEIREWQKLTPYATLPDDEQAMLFNEWALYLEKLGRLVLAACCYELNIEIRIRQGKLTNASICNRNLCDVWLLSGRLPSGLVSAAEALRLAEITDDAAQRCFSHAYRAHARALRGEISAALADFCAALDWQYKAENDNDQLYSNPCITHARLLGRLGRREEAAQLITANHQKCVQIAGDDHMHLGPCNLVLSDILHTKARDRQLAESLCTAAHDWAVARDAKEVLCWYALVQARIELSVFSLPFSVDELHARWALDEAEKKLADGLKIARDCGYGIFHIDLLLERARLHLLRSNPSAALDDLRVALVTGVPADVASGPPELLAATHADCGYNWAVAAGLHLYAESLLLQAAQSFARDSFVVTERHLLPVAVKALIDQAETCLHEALERWRSLRDPEPNNKNFVHNTTRDEYNYRAAETFGVLDDLARGVLTHVFQPAAASETVYSEPINDTKTKSFDVFLIHNSKDKSHVKQLGTKLKQRGFSVWLDEWELPPGADWHDTIDELIRTCRSAAVCVGDNGMGTWELREYKAVLQRYINEKKTENKLRVIPVLLPGAPPEVDLPTFLQSFTLVDLRSGFTEDRLDSLQWGITGIKPNN